MAFLGAHTKKVVGSLLSGTLILSVRILIIISFDMVVFIKTIYSISDVRLLFMEFGEAPTLNKKKKKFTEQLIFRNKFTEDLYCYGKGN